MSDGFYITVAIAVLSGARYIIRSIKRNNHVENVKKISEFRRDKLIGGGR